MIDLHIDKLYDKMLNEALNKIKSERKEKSYKINDKNFMVTYSKSYSCLLDKAESVLYISTINTEKQVTFHTQCYPFQSMTLISDSILVGFTPKKFYEIDVSKIDSNDYSISAKIIDTEFETITAIFPDNSRENSMAFLDSKHVLYRQILADFESPEIITTEADQVSSNIYGVLVQKLDGIHMIELGSNEITERFVIPKVSPTTICALKDHFVLYDEEKEEAEIYNASGSFSQKINDIKAIVENEITPVFATKQNKIKLIEPFEKLVDVIILSGCPYEKAFYYWTPDFVFTRKEIKPPDQSHSSNQYQGKNQNFKGGQRGDQNKYNGDNKYNKDNKNDKQNYETDKKKGKFQKSQNPNEKPKEQQSQTKLTKENFPSLSETKEEIRPIIPDVENKSPVKPIQQKSLLAIIYGKNGLSFAQVRDSVPEPCKAQFVVSTRNLNIFYLLIQSQLSPDDLAVALSKGCSGAPVDVFDNPRGKQPQEAYVITGKGQPATADQLEMLLSGFPIQSKVVGPYFIVKYAKPKKANLSDLFFYTLLTNVQFKGEKLRVYQSEKDVPTVCVRGYPDMPKKEFPGFFTSLFTDKPKDLFLVGKVALVNFNSPEEAEKAVAESDYKEVGGNEIEVVRFTSPLWFEDEAKFVVVDGVPPKLPCKDLHKILSSQGLVHVMKGKKPNHAILVYNNENSAKQMKKKLLKGMKVSNLTLVLVP